MSKEVSVHAELLLISQNILNYFHLLAQNSVSAVQIEDLHLLNDQSKMLK